MFHKIAKSIAIMFLVIQATLIATETEVAKFEDDVSSQMQTFLVAPDDLHFDHDNIVMNLNGYIYYVHSLRKSGNHWIAEAAVGETCAWGHPLCGYCNLCHHRICPLYQSRCSKSK